MTCAGLLLAAGGGSRMGTAKALVDDPGGGSFVERGVRVLRDGGCSPVVVVVGAQAERATALATAAGADLVVEASDWASGQSASLRRGLEALRGDRTPTWPASCWSTSPTWAPTWSRRCSRAARATGPPPWRARHTEGCPGTPS